jgi:hypothetical protein
MFTHNGAMQLRAPKKTTKDEDRIDRIDMKEKAKVSSSFFYPVYPVNPVYALSLNLLGCMAFVIDSKYQGEHSLCVQFLLSG